MTESQRSGSFPEDSHAHDDPLHGGTLSGGEAAELEQLRREASILREQLRNTTGSARGPREIAQLEARIDSLAARNAKLMDTLKEARQQLLALREEVDRLGQPPSGYGVLLAVQVDDTVDVFSGGRKMRVSLHPEIDGRELDRGAEVVLNESLNVVLARAHERTGEIVTFKELLEDGHRAMTCER